MKFIKELISSKNWSRQADSADLDEETLRRDLQDGDLGSIHETRAAERLPHPVEEDDDPFTDFDPELAADDARPDTDPRPASMDLNAILAEAQVEDEAEDAADDDWAVEAWDEDLEPEPFDIGLSDEDEDSPAIVYTTALDAAEEDVPEDDDLLVFDDPAFEDEEQAAEIEQAALEAVEADRDMSDEDKQALIEEIRRAMESVRHVRSDEEAARQAAARQQLGLPAETQTGERLLDTTNEIMDEDGTTRRRQAIALMKAAASATRTDPKLKAMTGRDPAADPLAQSEYRQDLRQLERPDLSRVRSRASEPLEPDQMATPAPEEDLREMDEPVAMTPEWTEDPVDGAEMPDVAALQEEGAIETPRDEATPMAADTAPHTPEPAEPEAAPMAEDRVAEAPAAAVPDMPATAADEEDVGADEDEAMPDLRAALLAARDAPEPAAAPEPQPEPDADASRAGGDAALVEMPATAADDDAAGTDEDEPMPDLRAALLAARGAPEPAATPEPQPEPDADTSRAGGDAAMIEMPAPTLGRAGRQAGRVKTRLLGFQQSAEDNDDPFAAAPSPDGARYPVGWIVVIEGPGRGHSFAVTNGVTQIGRGEDQAIRLDFGDSAISRQNHAAIAYDDEQNAFFLGHGGKSNLVRLNGKPVLSTEPLHSGDRIRIGETTLRFIAFCDNEFTWSEGSAQPVGKAAIA